MFRTLSNIRRLFFMACALARHDALLPREYRDRAPASLRLAARLLGRGGRADAHLSPGQRLAKALEAMGPSAIKVGQFLATRPDIIGAEVARGLESLQDRLPPFAEADASRIVETELRVGRTGCFRVTATGTGLKGQIPLSVPGPDWGTTG